MTKRKYPGDSMPEQLSVLNRVRTHLLNQKEKSVWRGTCKYRGDRGLMCAIGCLISDEHYNPNFDYLKNGTPVDTNDILDALKLSGVYAPTELLKELQKIHDLVKPEFWYLRLYKLEKRIAEGEFVK